MEQQAATRRQSKMRLKLPEVTVNQAKMVIESDSCGPSSSNRVNNKIMNITDSNILNKLTAQRIQIQIEDFMLESKAIENSPDHDKDFERLQHKFEKE